MLDAQWLRHAQPEGWAGWAMIGRQGMGPEGARAIHAAHAANAADAADAPDAADTADVPDEESDEFGALFRAEYAVVAHAVFLMLGDREAARDVTQEAFIQLLSHWKKVSSYDKPGAWVRRVAIRLAGRAAAGESRRRAASAGLVQPVTAGPADLDLQRALLRLAPAQRAAVILHYLEDRPVREVAEVLGCQETTARVHLHRGRRRLEELLSENQGKAGTP
jgi:RNA polymerase sigma-70 factor, ECF subfamily